MLAAYGLGIGYDGMPIGRGIDLSVKDGEVLCLLGPNGCGKTTLFKTLLGLIPAQAGSVKFDGRDVEKLTRTELARKIGYVPQASQASFPFSTRDIVLMGRASHVRLFSAPSQRDHAAADSALRTLGIAHLWSRPFTDISGGERQLVLIARALAQEPRMLVMDEPTASLDFGNQAKVLGCIRDLAKSGLAIVLSTHDPSHALACADRTALMKSGSLLALGPTQDVVMPDALKQIYGVDVVVAYIDAADRRICVPALNVEPKGATNEDQRTQYSQGHDR